MIDKMLDIYKALIEMGEMETAESVRDMIIDEASKPAEIVYIPQPYTLPNYPQKNPWESPFVYDSTSDGCGGDGGFIQ